MNKFAALTLTVFCAAILGGCGANAVNTMNKTSVNTNTANVAVVVNNNSAVVTNSTNTANK